MEIALFVMVLFGIAVFHRHTLPIAVFGLLVILSYKITFVENFSFFQHMFGSQPIMQQICDRHSRGGEWAILLNLFGLLLGFAILSRHFGKSRLPDCLCNFLPKGYWGPFTLLVLIFVISSFLDNIAAAIIGWTIASTVFRGKIHTGYVLAIVAASNAGGTGSVIGDTTTTMMWIEGKRPLEISHAYIAALPALAFFSVFASFQQSKLQTVEIRDSRVTLDKTLLAIVVLILAGAILANVLLDFPAFGVWFAIFIGAAFRKTPWGELKKALPGSIFLISLVICASLMPVASLPKASLVTTFVLGFVSSVFDNIPLTKIALEQGGYDWGLLAYAVGFGGSMIWFGSSAGVAVSGKHPGIRSVAVSLRHGWHIIVAYILGFFVLCLITYF